MDRGVPHAQKYCDGDRSQHELTCIVRVLEVALLYDEVNVTSLASFELLCRRAQLIMGAHAHDAQHPQFAGSEFYMDGLDTDALDPMLQKKVMEAVKSRAKQAESLARVAEAKVKLPRVERAGQGCVSLRLQSHSFRWCHRSFAQDVLARK